MRYVSLEETDLVLLIIHCIYQRHLLSKGLHLLIQIGTSNIFCSIYYFIFPDGAIGHQKFSIQS